LVAGMAWRRASLRCSGGRDAVFGI
jgi:hypothetical protein